MRDHTAGALSRSRRIAEGFLRLAPLGFGAAFNRRIFNSRRGSLQPPPREVLTTFAVEAYCGESRGARVWRGLDRRSFRSRRMRRHAAFATPVVWRPQLSDSPAASGWRGPRFSHGCAAAPRGELRDSRIANAAAGVSSRRRPECRWSGRRDSNSRPLAPHASALPGCATARHGAGYSRLFAGAQTRKSRF